MKLKNTLLEQSISGTKKRSDELKLVFSLGSIEELKDALESVLDYMVDNDFRAKVKQRRDELKSKKVRLPEVREMIFEEMFETMPEDKKQAYSRLP